MLALKVKSAPSQSETRDAAKPIYPANPFKGEVDLAALRDSVMKRISKARAYLAK